MKLDKFYEVINNHLKGTLLSNDKVDLQFAAVIDGRVIPLQLTGTDFQKSDKQGTITFSAAPRTV